MREHLCHVQRWPGPGHRVLEEEEGDVSLVTQLDKMAAFERRFTGELSIVGYYTHLVAINGHKTLGHLFCGVGVKDHAGMIISSLLPVYLGETSDQGFAVTSLKLLEPAPVRQPTDNLAVVEEVL